MRNASGQQGENLRQGKKNSEQEHKQKNFCVHNDVFSQKNVTRKIRVATTATKKCTKKVCCTRKVVVC